MDKRRDKSRSTDLTSERLPDIDVTHKPPREVAYEVFRIVEARTIETIDWYLREKQRKAFWSRTLRVMSVIGVAFGAVTPLLTQITGSLSLIWGYLALGFAALSIGIDKALGFSGTWLRYMKTATRLQQALYHSQLEWANLSAERAQASCAVFDIDAAWTSLFNLSDRVSEIVRTETEEWSADIASQLSVLEARAKSQ